MPPRTYDCTDTTQLSDAVEHAAEVLRAGGLVVFPTETVYGVGATVASEQGMQRLRALKDRPADKPFSVHMPNVDAIGRYVDLASQPALKRLASKTMPGPVTYVAEAPDDVIDTKLAEMGLPADARTLLFYQNTIGLRCPEHPVAEALLAAVSMPVVASSANPAGEREPHDAQASAKSLGDAADVILDGGACRYREPSSVVRVSGSTIEMLRQGVYDLRYLNKLLKRSILFVCSGNTCRSPMAEMIACSAVAQRLGGEPADLKQAGFEVSSAGVFAAAGSHATPEAVAAVEALGIVPAPHRSRPLDLAMLQDAEVVYCMTESHRRAVLAMLPAAADRTMLLDQRGDIEDPIGASAAEYLRCARQIQQAIDARLDALNISSADPVKE